MARYSFGMRSTVAGTAARAMMGLFAPASTNGKLRQASAFNSTSTALAVALARFTNATGVGAGQTEGEYDEDAPPPLCTIFAGHTADGGVGQSLETGSLGAAVGSGLFFTYGESGILIQPGTANGLGLLCHSGSGQVCDVTYHWDE